MQLDIFKDREQIKDFEREYNTWLSSYKKEKAYARHYFLAHNQAIRLYPSVINFTVKNPEIYQEIDNKFRALSSLIGYRKRCEGKREEELSEELDLSKLI